MLFAKELKQVRMVQAQQQAAPNSSAVRQPCAVLEPVRALMSLQASRLLRAQQPWEARLAYWW